MSKRELSVGLEVSGAELFRICYMFTSWEANTLVRSASGQGGFDAWSWLFEHYNPQILARALNLIFEIINPTKPNIMVQLLHGLEN